MAYLAVLCLICLCIFSRRQDQLSSSKCHSNIYPVNSNAYHNTAAAADLSTDDTVYQELQIQFNHLGQLLNSCDPRCEKILDQLPKVWSISVWLFGLLRYHTCRNGSTYIDRYCTGIMAEASGYKQSKWKLSRWISSCCHCRSVI